jgi:hypothetical protein
MIFLHGTVVAFPQHFVNLFVTIAQAALRSQRDDISLYNTTSCPKRGNRHLVSGKCVHC